MEKKNMVLLTVIAIATLLVAVVGATFAYFTATVTDNRTGDSNTKGQADISPIQTPGNLAVAEVSSNQFSSFNAQNVYPGHKELIALKITSSSDNTTDAYFDIVFKGENTFPENTIKFQIYESKKELTQVEAGKAFICTQESEDLGSGTQFKLYEKCDLESSLKLLSGGPAQPVATKQLQTTSGSQTVVLNGEHPFVITGEASDKTLYYYVVVEYENKDSSQNDEDTGKKLDGNISIQMAASDSSALRDDDEKVIDEGE